MLYILCTFLFFLLSVVIHIIYCHFHKQRVLHIKAFCVIAVGNGMLLIYCFVLLSSASLDTFADILTVPLAATSGVLYVLLIPTFINLYASIQLMSPSRRILLALNDHESLTFEELRVILDKESFITTRLDDLVTSGCARIVAGRYHLTGPGQRAAKMLNGYKTLLCREAGG